MTDADLTALRTWATAHAPHGCVQSVRVLDLLDRLTRAADRDALRTLEVADADQALADAERRLTEARAELKELKAKEQAT